MPKHFTLLAGLAALPLAALALAGCGGSGNKASSSPPKTAAGGAATVGISNTSLGKVLVNSQGLTLYMFGKDSPTTSACTGACAGNWPRFERTASRPSAAARRPRRRAMPMFVTLPATSTTESVGAAAWVGGLCA